MASKTEVYESLRRRIVTNELAPGEILNEKELMAYYDIGRTPLREVFQELHREGLIKKYPRSGTFVAPLDLQRFKQIAEIRLNLEGFAMGLAAKRITDEQIAALRQMLAQLKSMSDDADPNLKALTQSEFDFHKIIYEATKNDKLAEMLNDLHGTSVRFWHYLVIDQAEKGDQIHDLEAMVDALEERDAEKAVALIREHIQSVGNKIKSRII